MELGSQCTQDSHKDIKQAFDVIGPGRKILRNADFLTRINYIFHIPTMGIST